MTTDWLTTRLADPADLADHADPAHLADHADPAHPADPADRTPARDGFDVLMAGPARRRSNPITGPRHGRPAATGLGEFRSPGTGGVLAAGLAVAVAVGLGAVSFLNDGPTQSLVPVSRPGQASADGGQVSGQAASGRAGSGQAASGQAGSGQAGSGQAASGQAGSGQAPAGKAPAGKAPAGKAPTGAGKPAAGTLNGTFTLWSPSPGPRPCARHPQVPDVVAGAAVLVGDGAQVLARTTLAAGRPDATGRGCSFAFTVAGVPKAAAYQLKVADQPALRFTAADLAAAGWRVQLNLGVPSPAAGRTGTGNGNGHGNSDTEGNGGTG